MPDVSPSHLVYSRLCLSVSFLVFSVLYCDGDGVNELFPSFSRACISYFLSNAWHAKLGTISRGYVPSRMKTISRVSLFVFPFSCFLLSASCFSSFSPSFFSFVVSFFPSLSSSFFH